jgi:carbonic anhydrase/acetyltransferase-like protein (isoleucine patch superfamily)
MSKDMVNKVKLSRRTFLKLTGASAAFIALSGHGIGLPNIQMKASNREYNPITPWNIESDIPNIDPTAYVHPQATVIGNVHIGKEIMISPQAAVRGDEGMPLYVSDESNIQDGVVIHALETVDDEGHEIEGRTYTVDGTKYAVHIGDRVSLAHQAHVHGPAKVGNDTFVGMQSFIFMADVGNNCVLEPWATVIGVTVPDGRYVAAGKVITDQADADALPVIEEGYKYKHTNEAVVHVNKNLAAGYNALPEQKAINIGTNPITPWNSESVMPDIDPTAYVHPQASVIGASRIGKNIMISPQAAVRGDEGMPIHVGDDSNIQDGVILHALETIDEEGQEIEGRTYTVDDTKYAVYIGDRVSLAHQAHVHGPAKVGNDTFVGMQSFIFMADVGNNCVLEPWATVIGVTVPDGRYVAAGEVITDQADADALPAIEEGYKYKHTNEAVVHVNTNLAAGYNALPEQKAINIGTNPITPWNSESVMPDIDPTAYVHLQASVIGASHIGKNVMVSPQAAVRGDEGMPIHVGDDSNIQDGVILHALETIDEEGHEIEGRTYTIDGTKYAVYIGDRVSLAHQAHVHGPAKVGNDTFVGMQSFIFMADVGKKCVLEPWATVVGVTVPDGRYIAAGEVITDQADADALPVIEEGYKYQHTNEAVVHVNEKLAEGYAQLETQAGREGLDGSSTPTIEVTQSLPEESTPGFTTLAALGAVGLLAARALKQDEEKNNK